MTKKIRSLVLVAGAMVLGVAGCGSPSPQTSSSTHWVTCTAVADCASVSGAAACTGGFCVDAQGSRVQSVEPTDTGPTTCDPLAPHELPVTLGTILGVGKDAQGTIYMADETVSATLGTVDRVFVSSGNTLYRKRLAGSGSSSGGGFMDFAFTNDDGSSPGTLLLERPANGPATSMAAGVGGKGFIGDAGRLTRETLTVLPSSVIQGMTLRNLPGEVDVTYVADVANGNVLLVTQARDDWDGTYKVYYGAPDDVSERTVVNSGQTLSNNLRIQFLVGSVTFDASTGNVFGGDAGPLGRPDPTGDLVIGDGPTITFTQRLPTPTTLPGLTFTCL